MSTTAPARKRPAQRSGERVTVALTARVSRELDRLKSLTGLSKTDLVNRALSLYLFVEEQRTEGRQLAVYDPDKKEFQLVHIA
jgi:hypothetical protein